MSGKDVLILLADDDDEDKEILEESILTLAPQADIRTVNNGQQVIEYLDGCGDKDLPTLIVLDYKMPILNAVEVLERMSNVTRYDPIPKVVWSSSRQPEHVKKCMDNGAVDYFIKPNRVSDLDNIAAAILSICDKNSRA
jgi:CheY-like chemotaxis protein